MVIALGSVRKIIHVDMDCFYAAVEMLDNPALRSQAIAVGGSKESRGVISTCNYAARKFGVRSAMPTAHALRLCPQLVLVPGRMDRYRELSRQIQQIFAGYTALIEPLSLDEAYLDVSDCELFNGSATRIAEQIRRDIYQQTGLTASAGVASCKFIAKIASDENKPDGLCVVPPSAVDAFLLKQPLSKIPGVGKVTFERLKARGLYTCEQLRTRPLEQLVKDFGKFGPVLWERVRGIDERKVQPHRRRKSVGVEHTLSADIHSIEACWEQLEPLYTKLQQRLSRHQPECRIQTQGVKLKFSDFRQTTVEQQLRVLDKQAFKSLLAEAFARRAGKGVRLVGLQVSLPAKEHLQQLTLPLDETASTQP